MRLKFLSVFLGTLLLTPALISQQQATYEQEIAGYAGLLTVLPNANLHTVTIELVQQVNGETAGSPLVYVLLGNFQDYPAQYSGRGRILVGKTYFGIFEPDSKGGEVLESYTFPERDLAPQIKSLNTKTRRIFGIAQYGQETPLNDEQVQELARNGVIKASPSDPLNTALDRFSQPQVDIQASPDANQCDSGGPGSLQCAAPAGGCSVSCSAGYHSCCTGTGGGSSCTCVPN